MNYVGPWSAKPRGPLKKKIKGTRFLLLRNSENLEDEHLPRLDQALRLNEPLLLGWYLKEELLGTGDMEKSAPLLHR